MSLLNKLVDNQNKELEIEIDKNNEDNLNYSTSLTNNAKEEIIKSTSDENNNKNTKTGFFSFGKKKKEKVEEPKPNDVVRYFLISDLLINDKCKNIFNSKMTTYHYSLKELKECKNKDDIAKNQIIKIKNFLSSLLCNYRQLVKTDFDEGTTDKILDILRELRSYMKSSNFVIDGSIPSEWYVNSLINKIKFVQKGILFYQDAKQSLIDILLNKKVINIVEKDPIKVELSFKYDQKKKRLKIKPLGIKEKQIYLLDNADYTKKGLERVCSSVKDFCKHFPNLVDLQSKHSLEADVFDLQLKLDIPGQLQIYFENVKDYLSKVKKITDVNSFNLINEKIYDYTMSKIYNKIFPNEPSNEDIKIYQNCIRLNWVEPKHFIPGKKNYVYDSFLPDAILNFDFLHSEKSPRKKIMRMINIFNSISNLVKFNNEGNTQLGVDDMMPILNYTLIKAQPKYIFSLSKFMEIYLGDLKKKKEDNHLMQLRGICENMITINNESLNDVTEEEYNRRCEESLKDMRFSKKLSFRGSISDVK